MYILVKSFCLKFSVFNFCKTTRQIDPEGLPRKVFSKKLSPIIISKIQDNRESLWWDFFRLNYLKSDLGKMNFRLKRKQKIIWKNVLNWSELKHLDLTVAFRNKAKKNDDIFPTK